MSIPDEVWETLDEMDRQELLQRAEFLAHINTGDGGAADVVTEEQWDEARHISARNLPSSVHDGVNEELQRMADDGAPQTEGAEIDEGRVPDVQAAQDAGRTVEGSPEAQPVQAARRRGPRAEGTPRRLDMTVHGCVTCPFCITVQVEFNVNETGENFPAGYYCGHPVRRTTLENHLIASVGMLEDTEGCVTGLGDWLAHHWKSTFPGTCPLPEVDQVEQPTGKRALDLG